MKLENKIYVKQWKYRTKNFNLNRKTENKIEISKDSNLSIQMFNLK